LNTELIITRDYLSASMAEKIIRAVQPDNNGLPKGTEIQMQVVGAALRIKVTSNGNLPSFLRTVDDLLSCIQVAEHASANLK
jgi:hypothetical protein